jgi:dienelactone hydrolase
MRARTAAILSLLAASLASPIVRRVAPAGEARTMAYDVRPGDHLLYRTTVTREVRAGDERLETRMAFDSHVLATSSSDGLLRVGFQRTRTSAEVVEYREGRKDRTAEERPRFAERLARRPSWSAEANAIGRDGWGRLPWSAVREAGGELMPSVRELPALPLQPVDAFARWRTDDDLGLVYRSAGEEERAGEPCVRVEGEDEGGGLKSRQPGAALRFWHCASGLVVRVEAEARYQAPPQQEIHEQVVIELVERRRDQSVRAWLEDPALAQGVLLSFLASDSLPAGVGPADLHALAAGSDVARQRLALAVLYRHRLPAPPAARLAELERSDDPRVRALALRLARPERPAGDPLERLARRVRDGGIAPDWRCGQDADWPSRVLAAQRFPGHLPGELRRRMATPGFEGRRYVVHVPEEYRGDEPFPLLLVLGGGPGRSNQTAQSASEVARTQGRLIVYPEAHGYWWDPQPTAAVRALLDELLGLLNVDTNRVFLTGSSNGGTGAFLYATLWRDRLAAAAPLMGAGRLMFEREPVAVENLADLPMLFAHGADDTVIPARATRETVAAIRGAARDAPVTEEILKGRGHDLFLASDDGRTLAFLERHVRDPFPRRVRFRTRSTDFGRAYWLEVAEKAGGMAEVAAAIEERVVRVTARRVRRLRLLLRRELVTPGPFSVQVDGREAWRGEVTEDCRLLQESWRDTRDPYRAHSFAVDVTVPGT